MESFKGVVKNSATGERFFGTITSVEESTELDVCAEKTDLLLVGNPFVTPQTGRHRVLPLSLCEWYRIDTCPSDIPVSNQFD